MKTQLITEPSNLHSVKIEQRFGRDTLAKHDSIEIVTGPPKSNEFNRLEVRTYGSNIWVNINIQEVKEVRRKKGIASTRLIEKSITLDRAQLEQLAKNLIEIASQLNYVEDSKNILKNN